MSQSVLLDVFLPQMYGFLCKGAGFVMPDVWCMVYAYIFFPEKELNSEAHHEKKINNIKNKTVLIIPNELG